MEYRWINGTGAGFEAARAVRRAVFVQEQGYSLIGEFDEQDEDSEHVIGYEAGEPVCTARLFAETPGVYHVGRVAVLPTLRGRGTGLLLMREILRRAGERGATRLVLNAQADKAGFYERAGFVCTGKEMLDEGQPHVEMELVLPGQAPV